MYMYIKLNYDTDKQILWESKTPISFTIVCKDINNICLSLMLL